MESIDSLRLRVVTQRLSITPTNQLPDVAPSLAASILGCKKVFQLAQGNGNIAQECAGLIHKLKSQLSAMLQEENLQARIAAAILIKATVDVGGWNVLQGVGPWIRELISIIGRSDTQVAKDLCIVTLTRIFSITRGQQTLTRELTTPSLAAFISVCLETVKEPSQPPETQTSSTVPVMRSFTELIALHPASFRPFVQQIQTLVLPLIAPTPSDPESEENQNLTPEHHSNTARKLLVLLHDCASKNTADEDWAKSVQVIVVSAHKTADAVLRAFSEHWKPRSYSTDKAALAIDETVKDERPEPLKLPGWSGIYAGVERLDGLLRTIHAYVSTTSSTSVFVPADSILNLADRILSILQPNGARGSRIHREIARNEREGLEAGLPQLHVSALKILSLLLFRIGSSFAATLDTTLEQASWVLENERTHDKVRRAVYELMSMYLIKIGPARAMQSASVISLCMEACCEDLLPAEGALAQGGEASSNLDADSYFESIEKPSKILTTSEETAKAAENVLSWALIKFPSGSMPYALRARIDKIAVVTGNRNAMLASVLNSSAGTTVKHSSGSILPLLARAKSSNLGVEALIRPQMPVIRQRRTRELDRDFCMREEVLDDDQNDIPILNSQASHISKKRDRGNEFPFEGEEAEISAAKALQELSEDEEQACRKRARMTSTEAEVYGREAYFSDDVAVPGLQIQPKPNSESSTARMTGHAGGQYPEDPADSDGSAFEMPTLHLEPDSGEEGEEGDEDEEDDA